MPAFAPIVPLTAPCKICGGISGIFGVVDFNKNCEAGHNRFPLPPAGIPIYYHRCSVCALIFTVAFDEFSKDDFTRHIYNDSYKLVDPEYGEIRPASNAAMLAGTFGKTPAVTTLDYGGGNGKTAELLRASGFFNARSYDPFFPASGALPTQKFQLIICFEVLEHSPTPIATLIEMFSLLADGGMILFSTLTQPPNIDQIGLNWFYVGPRNGHVTLYSVQSLQVIAKKFGMTYASAGEARHVFFKTVPDFARHLIR
jgi:2-polyprenyl-6-hydroxyphenyl methylase/3-demethylubiquinone-9 3-methyltransferase